MFRCSILFRGLFSLLTLAVLLVSGCSAPAAPRPSASGGSPERAYMEFRASHAGIKIPPRQTITTAQKPATTVAMAPPEVSEVPPVPPVPPVASAPKPRVVEPVKVVAPVVKGAAPVVKVAKVAPAPKPKPVKIAKVTKPTPRLGVKRRPSSQSLITRNRSLVASDGYLASSLSVTDKERNFKPIRSKAVPKPLAAVVSLDELIRGGRAGDAVNVLRQINDVSLPVAAEAMRIILKTKPTGGESRLFAVVRNAKAAALRAMAIDTLFRAYPGKATYSAQRLLHQTRYNRIDRLVVGDRILQHRVSRTFTAAVTNLGYDHSGKAFFNARRSVLSADKRITRALKNYQTQYTGKHSSFIARRLYHWIRNDDSIEEAYTDTFKHHPSAMGVTLFQERFGDEATVLLHKALKKSKRSIRPAIKKALADQESASSRPGLRLGSKRLFVIEYQTHAQQLRILTDRAIGADQMPHQTVTYVGGDSRMIQSVITLERSEVTKLKNMNVQWQAGVQVAGQTVDLIDLK